MADLEVPELVYPEGLTPVAMFKASLDQRMPFASNSKGGLVYKLAVEHAYNDVAWPLQQLSGQWFWVSVVVPVGRPSIVDTNSFLKWEASLGAEGTL